MMETRELIKKEYKSERLDVIYCLLKAIEEDLKIYTAKEILDEVLFKEDLLDNN